MQVVPAEIAEPAQPRDSGGFLRRAACKRSPATNFRKKIEPGQERRGRARLDLFARGRHGLLCLRAAHGECGTTAGPRISVRAEEFINYFPYSYPQPESAQAPFKPTGDDRAIAVESA